MARAYRVPIEQLAARLPGCAKHLKYCCPAITVSPEQAMITPLRSAANCSPATRPGASLPTAPSAGDAGTVLTCLNCHLCGNHHAGLAGLTMDRRSQRPRALLAQSGSTFTPLRSIPECQQTPQFLIGDQ